MVSFSMKRQTLQKGAKKLLTFKDLPLTKRRYEPHLSVKSFKKEKKVRTQQTSNKEQQSALAPLHKRFGRRSRGAAIVLIVASFAMLVISYFYPSIVLQLESIIAFIAAIVLLFREQRHSVQLRIVTRMLNSSHEFIESLARDNLNPVDYSYFPLGPGISDVAILPSSELGTQFGQLPDEEGARNGNSMEQKSFSHKLVPPGRGLAELFEREIPSRTLDELIGSLSAVVCQRFELASAARAIFDGKVISVILVQPALKDSCNSGGAKEPKVTSVIGCAVCSMLATLICYTTRRETKLNECLYDMLRDVSTVRLELGEPLRSRYGVQAVEERGVAGIIAAERE
jgi:hypothetical protein